jgi:hypothetical protein
VVLGVAHPHNGRDGSEALTEAKDILMQRGSTPRIYRNMLVFIAADARQLDNLKDAVRASLAWGEIVRDIERLNLTQSDSALAKAKLAEANETMKTRLKEAWCYLHYPWNGKPYLSLKDLREYLNRYIYLLRLKNQEVLIKAVQAAISGMLPGPFAYAERWDEKTDTYLGLAIERAGNAAVVIDSDSVIIKPDVAEAHRPAPPQLAAGGALEGPGEKAPGTEEQPGGGAPMPLTEKKPTRFTGAVMISPDRPARDIDQIVEAILEQLTTLPGSQIKLRLEIETEVPSGLERTKVRTLVENANTLGFIERSIE